MRIISQSEAEERLSSENNLLNKISTLQADKSEAESASEDDEDEPELVETEEQYQALLNQVLALPDAPVEKRKRGQRGKQIPDFVREDIAVTAHFERNGDVAEDYAVAPSMVSEFKRGHVGGELKPELKNKVDDALTKIRKAAQKRLMQALRLIDTESLGGLNAVQLSQVAVQMSRVVENATPKESSRDTNVQFVLYKPEQRAESQFKQIEVG